MATGFYEVWYRVLYEVCYIEWIYKTSFIRLAASFNSSSEAA